MKSYSFASFFLDPQNTLNNKVTELFIAGLSTGSWKNKSHQVTCYNKFASERGFNGLRPTMKDIMEYVAFPELSSTQPYTEGLRCVIWWRDPPGVKSSPKTECGGSGYAVRLSSIPGSSCCPVSAWRQYRKVMLVGGTDPAFLHLDSCPFLLSITLLRALRTALIIPAHSLLT